MNVLLDIERSDFGGANARHQVFAYETDDPTATVATALRELNARPELVDADGNAANPINWECSCLQKKCGACAMVIDGRPQAACDARLASARNGRMTLSPLRKFPVISDLVVDRQSMFDSLSELGVWLEHEVDLPIRRSAVSYEASRCLQCGCCLEACPNFSAGGAFGGMASMVPLSRLLAELSGEGRGELARVYREHVFAGCGKSLACANICPAGIDISRLMSRSNAAALWSRF